MRPLLEVKNLTTHFHTQDGIVKAVNDVSYTVNRGETIALVGESGCGKTVSALSILRLVAEPVGKIVSGEVFFDDIDILKLPPDEMRKIRGNKISMIFQEPQTSLNPVLTIGRQISEGLELHRQMSKEDAERESVNLLKMVGIPQPDSRINDYPHQFSGGMRQRVMIAIAISCKPQLIIADEPTTAVDVTRQKGSEPIRLSSSRRHTGAFFCFGRGRLKPFVCIRHATPAKLLPNSAPIPASASPRL